MAASSSPASAPLPAVPTRPRLDRTAAGAPAAALRRHIERLLDEDPGRTLSV